MAMVQRCQLWLAQPLDDRQDSRVHQTDVGVCIAITDLADPPVVLRLELLHVVGASGDIIKEGHENPSVQPLPYPVVNLDKHRCRHDEYFFGLLD